MISIEQNFKWTYCISIVAPSFNQTIVGSGYPLAAQSRVKFCPTFLVTEEGRAIKIGGEGSLRAKASFTVKVALCETFVLSKFVAWQ